MENKINYEYDFFSGTYRIKDKGLFLNELDAKEYCEFKNNQSVQKSKIDDIIIFIKEERLAYSDEEGDDMFTNELIERLEDLTKNV